MCLWDPLYYLCELGDIFEVFGNAYFSLWFLLEISNAYCQIEAKIDFFKKTITWA